MQSWQDTFTDLKEQYIRRSSERLGKVVEMLAQLSIDPDLEVVRDLSRHFHWLAGSGTMYGFTRVTELGAEGEQFCELLGRGVTHLRDGGLDKLKEILNQLREQFANEADNDTAITTNLGTTTDEGTGRPADILIIDEDQNNLNSLSKLVDENGMISRTSRSISNAMSEIIMEMPTAIVIEIPLPDGDGYELVERIRGLPNGDESAIIIVSKQIGFLDKVRSIHCGADAHFEKPVDTKAMLRRIKYLVEKPKKQAAKILSVEDDPDQAAFIRAFLESAGYQVRTLTDPKGFDSTLSAFNPDLVLLDVMLPGLTGYELARYLRQDERYATLPILFLTTQGQLEARIEGTRSGGDEHLVKPVPPALLLASVSARLERARFLNSLMQKDGLTNLLNHSAFMEQAQKVVAQRKRHPGLSALIVIDVDYFRSINERHGYPGGDKVLVALSLLLQRRIRQSDIIGRIGGDEFGIIADGLDQQEALALCWRLLSDFSAISHSTPLHSGFYATASGGICMLDPNVMDMEKWLQSAYTAIYNAKKSGRNCAMAEEGSQFSPLR